MNKLKHYLEFALPLTLGLYCLIQGTALSTSADLMVRLVGFCLMFWVPGFSYYTWRGAKAWLRRGQAFAGPEAHEQVQEPVDSRVAA